MKLPVKTESKKKVIDSSDEEILKGDANSDKLSDDGNFIEDAMDDLD
jgi:hypothetical protein